MVKRHADLTHHELRAQLQRQGYSVSEQERLLTDAQLLRRQRAKDRAFTRIHRDEWQKILTPLRQEWHNAHTSAAYAPSDAQRVHAFMEYAEVLEHTRLHLLGRMMTVRDIPLTFDEYTGNRAGMGEGVVRDPQNPQMVQKILSASEVQDLRAAYEANKPVKRRRFTPAELARYMCDRYKREGKGFHVPNNGAHWADWISPKLRLHVTELFEQLAQRPDRKKRSRIKEPFKRVDAPDKFDDKRQALLDVAKKEAARLARLHMVTHQSYVTRKAQMLEVGRKLKESSKDLHVRLELRLKNAERACYLLERWTREDGALPRTWHGVLPKE
jgi:hypothetical protein